MTTLTVQELRDALSQLHPTDKVAVDVSSAIMAKIFGQVGASMEVGIDRIDPTPSTYGFHAIMRLNPE